jgi:hypothetical protein
VKTIALALVAFSVLTTVASAQFTVPRIGAPICTTQCIHGNCQTICR